MTNRSHLQRTGRVLCLDGGGIKGLVMTQMLYVLEETLGKPIHECFDWISGTSTGGFLALMVCMGKDVQTQSSFLDLVYFPLKPSSHFPFPLPHMQESQCRMSSHCTTT